MAVLIDLFGYLSVVLHGLVIVAQSMTVGGVLFLVLLARPFAEELAEGAELARRTARLAIWSAVGLVVCEALTLAMQSAVLVETLGLPVQDVLGAEFAVAGLVKMAAAIVVAACLFARRRVGAAPLLGLCAVALAAAVATTHSAARLADNWLLMAATALHLLGAAIWIGGIPTFVMALQQVGGGATFRRVGARFSRMSMAGVLCILASAVVFTALYIGTWKAAYGTAYGVMVGAKTVMFGALLLLGWGNFLLVERLRADPRTSVLRLRRFAEVEIGVGISIFLTAASLTSVPPAVDLKNDRLTWAEIAGRNAPEWPSLRSPEYDALAVPRQVHLDREAAEQRRTASPAWAPGSSEPPTGNAADLAWSEYNHHWAGLFVTLIGVVALLHRAGVGWARHWPLILLGLAAFLFLRSDPEVWPLGEIGFFASLGDVEVLQHRVFVLLVVVFAVFEWGVRTGRLRSPQAALVFPLLTAIGGALLLTHSHAIANVKEQLLIELSHTPLALAGITAGWARWLELRADGRVRLWAGWVWPVCFVVVGAILLNYREA